MTEYLVSNLPLPCRATSNSLKPFNIHLRISFPVVSLVVHSMSSKPAGIVPSLRACFNQNLILLTGFESSSSYGRFGYFITTVPPSQDRIEGILLPRLRSLGTWNLSSFLPVTLRYFLTCVLRRLTTGFCLRPTLRPDRYYLRFLYLVPDLERYCYFECRYLHLYLTIAFLRRKQRRPRK